MMNIGPAGQILMVACYRGTVVRSRIEEPGGRGEGEGEGGSARGSATIGMVGSKSRRYAAARRTGRILKQVERPKPIEIGEGGRLMWAICSPN